MIELISKIPVHRPGHQFICTKNCFIHRAHTHHIRAMPLLQAASYHISIMTSASMLRLMSDLRAIKSEPPEGCSASPVTDDNL